MTKSQRHKILNKKACKLQRNWSFILLGSHDNKYSFLTNITRKFRQISNIKISSETFNSSEHLPLQVEKILYYRKIFSHLSESSQVQNQRPVLRATNSRSWTVFKILQRSTRFMLCESVRRVTDEYRSKGFGVHWSTPA